MAQKPTKIDDVKRPGKAAPLPTSRPIVVTNRPMLASDPMVVVPTAQETDESKPMTASLRTAKPIKPLDSTLMTPEPDAEAVPDSPEPEPSKASDNTTPELAVDIDALHEAKSPETESAMPTLAADSEAKNSGETVKPEVPIPAVTAEKPDIQPKLERDPEAELSAEEIAAAETKAKRDLELEQVIVSGKYHVPINAVQRRRSRVHVLLLCAVGLLLAVALADVVIDAGFVKLPFNIPHTHFFSTTASDS